MPVAVDDSGPGGTSTCNTVPSRVPVTTRRGGCKQNLVPANVCYHPTITSQTGSKQNLVPANVWYHPSITTAKGGTAQPQTGTETRGRQGKKIPDREKNTPPNVTLIPDQSCHSSDREKNTPPNVTLIPDRRSHSSDREKNTPPNVTLIPYRRSHSSDREKTTPPNVTLIPDRRSHSSDREKNIPRNVTLASDSPTSSRRRRRRCNDRAAPPPSPEEVPVGVGVPMEGRVVRQVEVLTRGQRENPAWFSWRKNRITASVAHRIAHCRFLQDPARHSPPASYLNSITGEGPHVQTRAMRWGVEREKMAVRKYQGLKSRALGRDVTVQECGLFIDPQRSWLAASPDGIVTDRRTGQWLLCLEVKCPYKHRERTVEEACVLDTAFCLEMDDRDTQSPMKPPVYRLKEEHSYYSQIQVQLAVTGLTQADLVIYTRRETAIVPVTFDPEWWAETVSKLEIFYRDALLPHLRNKHPAAAVEE